MYVAHGSHLPNPHHRPHAVLGSVSGLDLPGRFSTEAREPPKDELGHLCSQRRIIDDVPWAAVGPEVALVAARRAAEVAAEREGQLGQLASVLKKAGQCDESGDELRMLVDRVLQERRELEQQLERRQEFERQKRDSSRAFDEVLVERRRVQEEASADRRHIHYLRQELDFLEAEVLHFENDLDGMHKKGDLSRELRLRGGDAASEEGRRQILMRVDAERDGLQREDRKVENSRIRLEGIVKLKLRQEELQRELLEKQRHSEQDRGVMLTAIETERGKLSSMRAERLRMREEMADLEREMMDIAQGEWIMEHRKLERLDTGRPSYQETVHRKGIPTDHAAMVTYTAPASRGVLADMPLSVVHSPGLSAT